jgi:hypothetical protein
MVSDGPQAPRDTYSLLYSSMESALVQAELERRPEQGYSALIKLVRKYISQLKAATEQPFLDEEEEIMYFRDIWPRFYAKLFYYQHINAFESDRERKSREKQLCLIHGVEEVISEFFAEHKEFWTYYRGDAEVISHQFTRKHSRSCLYDPLSELLDRELATIAGYQAAWALAYKEFGDYLDRLKASLANHGKKHWEWRPGKTAAAEQIIAWVETGSIYLNGKLATISEIKADFEEHYNIDLTNFNNLVYASDVRKGDPAPYLNSLPKGFMARKERLGK